MAIVTEPTINEILMVADMATLLVDTEDYNTAIEDDITESEKVAIDKVREWALALESLEAKDEIAMATAVFEKHGINIQLLVDPNVEQCLTISTSHISVETAEKLNNEKFGLIMYDKADYGWWFYVADLPEDLSKVPEDLLHILSYAKGRSCTWLCLDNAADELSDFKTYEW